MISFETGGGHEKFKKQARRVAVFTGLAGIAVLGSGCGADRKEARATLYPAQRVDFDFGGAEYQSSDETTAEGSNCLESTAYDPIGGGSNKPRATVYYSEKSGITTIQAAGGSRPLLLTGFSQNNKPLQAADQYTREVLLTYGCPQAEDGGYK